MVNDTDVTEFTYNPMNQLTGITHPDSSTETLTYDDNGNLTQSVNNTTGETTTYTWDCNNRLLGVNTAGGEEMGFVYDSAGMLIREESAGVERRIVQRGTYGIREQVRSGQDIWENSVYHIPVSEHTSHEGRDGQILASYISPGKNRPDGGAIFYHPDHLGSVRLITDEAGRIIDRTETDAYGSPLPHTTGNATPGSQSNKAAKMLQPLNYTGTLGIRYVEKIRMHNMRARWHHPQTARFTSMDKLFATNRYNYVAGNPVMMVDPMGEHEIIAGGNKQIGHTHYFEMAAPGERMATYYMVPDAFLGDWEDREKYLTLYKTHWLFHGFIGSPLSEGEQRTLQILHNEALNYAVSAAIERGQRTNSFVISKNRYEFAQNCVGLAFAGLEGVNIGQTDSVPILQYNYRELQVDSKPENVEKSLKRGDVIIWGWDGKGYGHVATVAYLGKEGKCFKALLHERDGQWGVYATLFQNANRHWATSYKVYRPVAPVDYKYQQLGLYTEFPYRSFLKSDTYYKNILTDFFHFKTE